MRANQASHMGNGAKEIKMNVEQQKVAKGR